MTTMLEELDESLGYELGSEVTGKMSRPATRTGRGNPIARTPSYQRVSKTMDVPFRYICSLQYSGYGRATGILIGPRTVLTAGRAVHFMTTEMRAENQRSPRDMAVFPAYPADFTKAIGNKAVKFLPCPGYVRHTRTDLALIHLDKPLGNLVGYWKEPVGMSIFENAQPVLPAGLPTVSLAGYPAGSRRDSQYRADNIAFIGFKPGNGLLTYIKFKVSGHVGSPVWGVHPSTGARILVGVHIGPAPGQTANHAVVLDDKLLKFIIANTK
jgi:V8-like Glu-specific endopeptidase